jgi:DNA-binding SARP family transcriptional activator
MASSLVAAMRAQVPDLPEGLAAQADCARADVDQAAVALALAAALADGLERHLTCDVVLVLDDVHELSPGDPATRLVDGLVRLAPARLRIVLSSRTRLPVRVERLRGCGQVLDLDGTALAFTADETAALLAQNLGGRTEELAAELQSAVHGWPAAVRMASETLRAVPVDERPARLRRALRPGGPVYDYLAEEVFDAEPAHVRDLVAHVAVLPHFSVSLCEALGLAGAAEAIHALDTRGLLTETRRDRYRLHPLVRAFAQARLPMTASCAHEVSARAGQWFAASEEHRDALACLLAAGDLREATALLVLHGSHLVGHGEAQAVVDAVAELGSRGGHAALDLLEGEARHVLGDAPGALRCFGRLTDDGPVPAGVAWRIGSIHHLAGRLDEALTAYGRGDLENAPLRDAALLQAWHASALWLRGDLLRCRELSTSALALADQSQDDKALAAAHTARAMLAAVENDPLANEQHYATALLHAERAHDVLAAVRIRLNRGSRLVGQAQYAEALEQLDLAVTTADLSGYAPYRAMVLNNRGEALLGLGRLDEAITELTAARTLFTQLGSRFVALPMSTLGEVYRLRGDLALARSCFEAAIAVAEGEGDAQALTPALAGLSRTLVDDDPELARELALRAVSYGPVTGHPVALLALGRVHLRGGDHVAAADAAARAAELSRRRRDTARVADALELAAEADSHSGERLLELLGLRREIGDVLGEARAELLLARREVGAARRELASRAHERFRVAGATRDALAALHAGDPETSAAVRVECLGGFRVLREGRAVPVSDWPSRKARDLLKILVASQGRPVPRAVLAELLWPDEPEAVVSARLSVALSSLRAVLDPDKRHPAVTFVGGDRGAVWLQASMTEVDVQVFVSDARASLAQAPCEDTVRLLRHVETAYTGDFLDEDSCEDWSSGLREEARALYLRVARTLADAAVREGEPDAAIGYLLRILQRDAYDERAHVGLVGALEQSGAHGEARRAYRTYAGRMAELGVEPVEFPQGV